MTQKCHVPAARKSLQKRDRLAANLDGLEDRSLRHVRAGEEEAARRLLRVEPPAISLDTQHCPTAAMKTCMQAGPHDHVGPTWKL